MCLDLHCVGATCARTTSLIMLTRSGQEYRHQQFYMLCLPMSMAVVWAVNLLSRSGRLRAPKPCLQCQ